MGKIWLPAYNGQNVAEVYVQTLALMWSYGGVGGGDGDVIKMSCHEIKYAPSPSYFCLTSWESFHCQGIYNFQLIVEAVLL